MNSRYSAGTVTATNGSTNITGVGTAFVGAVQAGDDFVGPDRQLNFVASVQSDTQLTLGRPYLSKPQAITGSRPDRRCPAA